MNKVASAMPLLPVAWGEAFDKLTILQIKSERIKDAEKLSNVERERREIEAVVQTIDPYPDGLDECVNQLKAINSELWDIEDAKRDCERIKRFDERFIRLARDVYLKNDLRAAIKKRINHLLGSALVEEKSYTAY
jgi:hypothetical protein